MESRDFVRLVEEQLRSMGLTDDIFDPEEIADDLLERTELNETLEELVDSANLAPAPTSFDPGWSS